MGQKVNPHGLRVGVIKDWDSRWYASDEKVGDLIVEDQKIRKYLKKTLYGAGVPKIEIERSNDVVTIFLHCARPGMVIGKGGEQIEQYRLAVEKLIGKKVRLNIVEVKNPDMDAQLVAENIAQQLEKRISHRRAMKNAMARAMRAGAKGIKVCCSGRLGGREIAGVEHYHEGTIPLQTIRADIEYGFAEAATTFGRIGVKVWIYKGEVLSQTLRTTPRTMDTSKPYQERRERRPRRKETAVPHTNRRDQVAVASQKSAFPHAGTGFAFSVIVDEHHPAPDIDTFAEIRVSHIGKMRQLASVADIRIFTFDERADAHTASDIRPRTQMRVRPDGTVRPHDRMRDVTALDAGPVADDAFLHDASRPDDGIRTDDAFPAHDGTPPHNRPVRKPHRDVHFRPLFHQRSAGGKGQRALPKGASAHGRIIRKRIQPLIRIASLTKAPATLEKAAAETQTARMHGQKSVELFPRQKGKYGIQHKFFPRRRRPVDRLSTQIALHPRKTALPRKI